ncbi:MAG: cytochrome c biogenesis protein CcsA [Planctomycetaceae bacterium]|nr:cytochrome c biogenesis protein CcsA [Planctomycetaceae bacterium]
MDSHPLDERRRRDWEPTNPVWETIQFLLAPLASLKLTVVLLLMSVFIVFVGTLAQVDKDIWEVINEYFRTTNGDYLVWIKPSIFFPPAFFPDRPAIADSNFLLPFPKGWMIGVGLMLNLFAAHLVRFKVQSKGEQLAAGFAVFGIGAVATWLIIQFDIGGPQTSASAGTHQLVWFSLALMLFLLGTASAFAAAFTDSKQLLRRFLFGLLAVVQGGACIAMFKSGPMESGVMRILTQLLLALTVSCVLLAGAVMVFKKRGGIVLIHAGIALIMVHEVIVGVAHTESRMQIAEGQSVNYSSDIRAVELAIVDESDRDQDEMTVIPGSRFHAGEATEISDDLLPCKVRVLTYVQNSDVRNKKSLTTDDKAPENPATAGIGENFSIVPVAQVAGTDTGGQVDVPAAYVEFLDPKSGDSIQTLLVTPHYEESQPVKIGDKTYQVALRFKRIYHDFWVTLNDVQKNDYKGTSNPRDYSSFIEVEAKGGDFDQRIWMNNPMRYAGQTFYQSSYIPAGAMGGGSKEATVLQVVKNRGWMAPYVACMMVVVGMIAHFGVTLLRFLDRANRESTVIARAERIQGGGLSEMLTDPEFYGGTGGMAGMAVGLIVFFIALGYMSSKGFIPEPKPEEMNVTAFGQLPMWYKGRAMPMDTFARNALLRLSDRETARPPSTAWVFQLYGSADQLEGQQKSYQAFLASLDFAEGTPKFELPGGWEKQAAAATEEVEENVFARISVPVEGGGPLTLEIRNEVFLVPDYESFTEARVNGWQKMLGNSSIDSYAWRKNMRAAGELAESELAEGKFKQQSFDLAGEKDARQLATIVTPTKSHPRQTATEWLLVLMSDADAARRIPVLRLENTDVITSLDLDPHRSGLTYSMEEVQRNFEALAREAAAAGKIDPKSRNLRQKKVIEFANRVVLYAFLEQAISRPMQLPDTPDFGAGSATERAAMVDRLAAFGREGLNDFMTRNQTGPKPLVVPVHLDRSKKDAPLTTLAKDWDTLATAWVQYQYLNEFKDKSAPAITEFCGMLEAARDNDAAKFNKRLAAYHELLATHRDPANVTKVDQDLPLSKVEAEARYNRMELFSNLAIFYVISLVVAFVGWLYAPNFNQRFSFVFSLGLIFVYTYAIYMRMYISGRPPVTNLYSSAVFIGWATVLGGLILEPFTWKGFGNVVAAATGFAALRIADGLATDGDTIAVMEAVLDTQFWLATHVVCITLGYAATFLAGAFGLIYLLRGILTPIGKSDLDYIGKITYGTLCFATFFSFFGTVLGGLWADDSWGRFWGWDPKENGALIIVLWNAVILHARWGNMIKARGLAVLSVLGNIVVSWSWFGVNELGVGLHSYGFTEGRLKWLAIFATSQLCLAILGSLIPRDLWWSSKISDALRPSDVGLEVDEGLVLDEAPHGA